MIKKYNNEYNLWKKIDADKIQKVNIDKDFFNIVLTLTISDSFLSLCEVFSQYHIDNGYIEFIMNILF